MQKSAYILILIMCVITNSILLGAAETPQTTTISITNAEESRELDRNTLLKMPYFRVRIYPALYMRAMPIYSEYINTFKGALAAQSAYIQGPVSISLPERTDFNDFMFLYNELARMPYRDDIPIDVIVKEITRSGYASPERIKSILNLAQKLLTVPPTLAVLDRFWTEMIQKRFATSDGMIAKAFFAPQENLLETILALIKAEKKEIRIACYRMTHPQIICELGRAMQRFVRVTIVVDAKDTDPNDIESIYRVRTFLHLWNREWFGAKATMHHKFFLFSQNINDQPLLVTGSANCTWSAQETNEENMVVLNDPTLIDLFEKEFDDIKFFSKRVVIEDLEEAHKHIYTSCINIAEAKLDRFTPLARVFFSALARLFAKYRLLGQIERYGLDAIETQREVDLQLKELEKQTGNSQ